GRRRQLRKRSDRVAERAGVLVVLLRLEQRDYAQRRVDVASREERIGEPAVGAAVVLERARVVGRDQIVLFLLVVLRLVVAGILLTATTADVDDDAGSARAP